MVASGGSPAALGGRWKGGGEVNLSVNDHQTVFPSQGFGLGFSLSAPFGGLEVPGVFLNGPVDFTKGVFAKRRCTKGGKGLKIAKVARAAWYLEH